MSLMASVCQRWFDGAHHEKPFNILILKDNHSRTQRITEVVVKVSPSTNTLRT